MEFYGLLTGARNDNRPTGACIRGRGMTNWYQQKADELGNVIDTLKVRRDEASPEDKPAIKARIAQLAEDRTNYIDAAGKAK